MGGGTRWWDEGQDRNTSIYGVLHVNKWIGDKINKTTKLIWKEDSEHQTLSDGGDAREDNPESRHKPRQHGIYIPCPFHA